MVVDTHGTDSGMMRWDDEVGEVSRMVNATPTRTSDFIAMSESVHVGVTSWVQGASLGPVPGGKPYKKHFFLT